MSRTERCQLILDALRGFDPNIARTIVPESVSGVAKTFKMWVSNGKTRLREKYAKARQRALDRILAGPQERERTRKEAAQELRDERAVFLENMVKELARQIQAQAAQIAALQAAVASLQVGTASSTREHSDQTGTAPQDSPWHAPRAQFFSPAPTAAAAAPELAERKDPKKRTDTQMRAPQ